MKRRVKKRARRRLKLWVKLAILGLFVLIIGGGIGYKLYMEHINAEDPTGTIETPSIDEEVTQGEVEELNGEDTKIGEITYTVYDGTVLVKDGDTDIVLGEITDEVSKEIMWPIEYLVGGDASGHDVLNSVGKDIGVGDDVLVDDGFSFATFGEGSANPPTYIVYKDCSFLYLGDAEESDERTIASYITAPDVVVAAKRGLSNNNYIIKTLKPRIAVVMSGEPYSLPENLFKDSENSSLYVTGINGNLSFKCDGNIVTPLFDPQTVVTQASLVELKGEDGDKSTDSDDNKTAKVPLD